VGLDVRYATVVVEGTNAIHPLPELLTEEAGMTGETIVHFDVLDDGTGVLLVRLRGDLARVRELLAVHADVLAYNVSGDRNGLVYVRTRATADLEQLLKIPRTHEVFFETPIERIDANTLRVTVIGETSAAVGKAIADVPESLTAALERTGEYPRDAGDLSTLLTERQREVLAVAVEAGYYESPRRTTHEGIGDELDLAAGTVSEHLRKIETRVFSAIVE
jgi:hypothetical protein